MIHHEKGFSLYNSREELAKDLHDEAIKLMNAGIYKKAMDNLNDAVLHYPGFKEAYLTRGNLRFVLRDYQGSMDDFNETLCIDPEYGDGMAQLAFVKTELMQFEEALCLYEMAIKITPDCDKFYSDRGYLYRKIGILDKAIENYSRAIEFNTGELLYYFNRGKAKIWTGDADGAICDLKKCIESKIPKISYIALKEVKNLQNPNEKLKLTILAAKFFNYFVLKDPFHEEIFLNLYLKEKGPDNLIRKNNGEPYWVSFYFSNDNLFFLEIICKSNEFKRWKTKIDKNI